MQIPAMERLIAELPSRIPANDEVTTIAHGDYRLENVMFHSHRAAHWSRCSTTGAFHTLGHPLADIGYNAMLWTLEVGELGHAGGRRTSPRPASRPCGGLHVAAYCRRTGRDHIDDFNFYLAFAAFRLAADRPGRAWAQPRRHQLRHDAGGDNSGTVERGFRGRAGGAARLEILTRRGRGDRKAVGTVAGRLSRKALRIGQGVDPNVRGQSHPASTASRYPHLLWRI